MACALVGDPELLVLDEPTVGQDPVLRDELWSDFRQRVVAGATILVSSHVMEEAARCDEILLLREGALLAHESPAALLARTGTADLDVAFLELVQRFGQGVEAGRAASGSVGDGDRAGGAAGGRAAGNRVGWAADTTAGADGVGEPGTGGSVALSEATVASKAARRPPRRLRPGGTWATTGRILRQIRHDPRTLAIITVVPMLVITLLYYLFDRREPMVSKLALDMLVVFPILVMFLLAAIATVRERTSGTLERLMTTPVRKADILFGYALAFGVLATVQGVILTGFCRWVLNTRIAGPLSLVILTAIVGSLLGVAFGLLASALAQSEFQAVQFFPAMIVPQAILSGLFGPREEMAGWLKTISDVLPITYAVQAIEELFVHEEPTSLYWRSLAIAAACVVGLLIMAATTLRRRTS